MVERLGSSRSAQTWPGEIRTRASMTYQNTGQQRRMPNTNGNVSLWRCAMADMPWLGCTRRATILEAEPFSPFLPPSRVTASPVPTPHRLRAASKQARVGCPRHHRPQPRVQVLSEGRGWGEQKKPQQHLWRRQAGPLVFRQRSWLCPSAPREVGVCCRQALRQVLRACRRQALRQGLVLFQSYL